MEPRGPRLSAIRIVIAVAALVAVGLVSVDAVHTTLDGRHRGRSHWFAPYVDVTLTPAYDFQDPVANPNEDVVLAFVVAAKDEPCTPSWGGAYSLHQASVQLDLDRRLARLRARGGDAIVSFGGVANDELGYSCTEPAALAKAYLSVIDRYHLTAIDLDLEGKSLDDATGLERRAVAIASVQRQRRAAGKHLDVWVTLPMGMDGLQANGLEATYALLGAHVRLTGVNLMAMDYGAGRPASTSFEDASLAGVDAAAAQVRLAYRTAGTILTPAAAYSKLGVTPMIGQNDEPSDRLSTAAARRLFDRSVSRGVARFSMWSLNRDVRCGANVDGAVADNTCSGVPQEALEFSSIVGAVGGRATSPPRPSTTSPVRLGRTSGTSSELPGPYAAWRLRREYAMDAKVTWRGQVYTARWWNVGARPDAPVRHEWESPWRIVGPVLPGEKPAPEQTTIPVGSYPAWRQKVVYLPGDRVERLGRGYRAKWWTQGDDPSLNVDNDWETPWTSVGPPAGASTTKTGAGEGTR